MENRSATAGQLSIERGIPMPIVTLNRVVLVVGILFGLALGQPLFTTVLFVILLGAVLFGKRGSLIFQVGSRLLAGRNEQARTAGRIEAPELMRFNNSIAVLLLGFAQAAFLLGYATLGWVLALIVAAAALVALAGFCLGCFLYLQFKLNRFQLFR